MRLRPLLPIEIIKEPLREYGAYYDEGSFQIRNIIQDRHIEMLEKRVEELQAQIEDMKSQKRKDLEHVIGYYFTKTKNLDFPRKIV